MTNLSLPQKFDALESTLNLELVERRAEVTGAMTVLVANSTMFLLGPPGTAKSMLPNRISAYIADMKHFDILMTKFTQDSEVFGPTSLAALEHDRFERMIDGYLPTADSAMLDECFKANSSILNSLLWLINERKYRHGKTVIKVPLGPIFTASNEIYQDDSLLALYDRLMVRYQVDSVRDNSNFQKMLTTQRPDNPDPILHWSEVQQAQAEARAVVVPAEVIDALTELRKNLHDEGIEPSERRFVNSLDLIRASAWLDECDIADIEHMGILTHVFWDQPEQIPQVQELVLKLANPVQVEALEMLNAINKMAEEVSKATNEDDKVRIGNEVNGKLRRARDELEDLRKRAGSGKRSKVLDEVQDRLRLVTEQTLTEIFGFSPEEAKAIGDRKKK